MMIEFEEVEYSEELAQKNLEENDFNDKTTDEIGKDQESPVVFDFEEENTNGTSD